MADEPDKDSTEEPAATPAAAEEASPAPAEHAAAADATPAPEAEPEPEPEPHPVTAALTSQFGGAELPSCAPVPAI